MTAEGNYSWGDPPDDQRVFPEFSLRNVVRIEEISDLPEGTIVLLPGFDPLPGETEEDYQKRARQHVVVVRRVGMPE